MAGGRLPPVGWSGVMSAGLLLLAGLVGAVVRPLHAAAAVLIGSLIHALAETLS